MLEIKIQIPEGYDGIDEEKSNLAEGRIVFKKKKEVTPWRKTTHPIVGYYVNDDSVIRKVDIEYECDNQRVCDRNVFASRKQTDSMLAMAQLSQIIENDERFGGSLTDEEWTRSDYKKYVIIRGDGHVEVVAHFAYCYFFLAFHTEEQAELFLKENEDLIRQYYMLD